MRGATLRPGVQAGRRPAARDAGRPHPLRGRGRRVRRHRRPRHHRGHPRGDRRRDHRRVRRRERPPIERAAPTARSGSPPGCRSRISASSSTSSCPPTRSRPSAACSPRRSAGCRSRAPAPRSAACVLVAEGTTGRRNRIDTVLVRRAAERRVQRANPARTRGNPRMPDLPASAGRGRQAGHPGPGGPGPDRRRRGRGRARRGRPHLRGGDRRAAVAVADRAAAGRGHRGRVRRGEARGGRRGHRGVDAGRTGPGGRARPGADALRCTWPAPDGTVIGTTTD